MEDKKIEIRRYSIKSASNAIIDIEEYLYNKITIEVIYKERR